MCKLYDEEKRIWKQMGLILDDRCTNEGAITTVTGETDCPSAQKCKEVNKELKAWMKGKHTQRGSN